MARNRLVVLYIAYQMESLVRKIQNKKKIAAPN